MGFEVSEVSCVGFEIWCLVNFHTEYTANKAVRKRTEAWIVNAVSFQMLILPDSNLLEC